MNQLLPIIRRFRRPMIVKDTPPVMAGSVEPVKVENIQQPTSNIEQPTAGPAEAGTTNEGEAGQ